MTELTIAYFPIIKALIIFIMLYIIYKTFRLKYYKTSITALAFVLFMIAFSPIKYDGTNTNEYSRKNVRETTQIKESIQHEKVESKQLTFLQRIELESQRELSESLKIQQEINK